MAGVFTHFKNYASDGRELRLENWKKALDDLNLSSISRNDSEKIFKMLDTDGNERVPIATINNLFVLFNKKNRRSDKPSMDEICFKVLQAFNFDDAFLDKKIPELGRNGGLTSEAIVQYFTSLPKSTDFYSSEEIQDLAENFVDENGQVVYADMLKQMNTVRRDRKVYKDPHKIGIHEMHMAPVMSPTSNPMLFQRILTRTSQNFNKPDARNFRPIYMADQYLLDEIAKGLFLANKSAFDHFSQFVDTFQGGAHMPYHPPAQLMLTHFTSAVNALRLTWDRNQVEKVWLEMTQFANTGQQLSAERIDEYIYLTCPKTYEQYHSEGLQQVAEGVKRSGMRSFRDMLFPHGGQYG